MLCCIDIYWNKLGRKDYRDENGNGLFLNLVIAEELHTDASIENDLGAQSKPNDCAYLLGFDDNEFPIPSYLHIATNE